MSLWLIAVPKCCHGYQTWTMDCILCITHGSPLPFPFPKVAHWECQKSEAKDSENCVNTKSHTTWVGNKQNHPTLSLMWWNFFHQWKYHWWKWYESQQVWHLSLCLQQPPLLQTFCPLKSPKYNYNLSSVCRECWWYTGAHSLRIFKLLVIVLVAGSLCHILRLSRRAGSGS